MDAVQERKATLNSGVVLPYAEAGTPGGSMPVVLVHAYAESWRYLEPLLRSLPRSVHAFVPTQRGHPSVEGNAAGYRISDFADDLVAFMDAVGIARAVLVGASSGGVVARAVARRHPQRVAGLVLISSPVTLADKAGVPALRQDIMGLSDPVDRRFVERFLRSTSPQEIPEEFVARLVDESASIPAQVWREAFLGLLEADPPAALETLHVPTLVLTGSRDPIVGDDQQVLLDRLPDAELVVYNGVGHGPHLAHPGRVATDVAAFVHGHRVAAGHSHD